MNQKKMPLIPLRGLTVFPNMIIHFDVGRDKSLKAIEAAMMGDEKLVLVTQKETSLDEPQKEDLYEVGTIVHVKQIVKMKPPLIKVLVEGEARAKIIHVDDEEYMEALVERIEDEEPEDSPQIEALMRTIGELFEQYAKLNTKLSMDMVYGILGGNSPSEVVDLVIANIPLEVAKKQAILACKSVAERMYLLIEVLEKEVEVLKLQKNIYDKVKNNIDKTQKEYFLREQLKVIQEELGEKDGIKAEVDHYKKRME